MTFFDYVPSSALRLASTFRRRFAEGRDAKGRKTFTLEHGTPIPVEYHLPAPSLKANPERASSIDADGLSGLLSRRQNKVLVYTGAGMSSGRIPDFKTLKKSLGVVNRPSGMDPLARDIISNPSGVALKWRVWVERFLHGEAQGPTDAHRLLAELQERHGFTLATENLDTLHEQAGSRVFHSVNEDKRGNGYVYSDIHAPQSQISQDTRGVTHIVTVGIRGDWYGFLKRVRTRNPGARIISIGHGRPAFLGEGDYHHEADITDALRRLAKDTGVREQ